MLKFLRVKNHYIRMVSKSPFGQRSCGEQRFRYCTNHNTNLGDDLPLSTVSISDFYKVHSATALWNKEELFNQINRLIKCGRDDFDIIYKINKRILKAAPPKMITDNIQLLLERGVGEQSILNYPKILSISTVDLAQKLSVLENFKYLEDINHMVPFLNIRHSVLERVVEISQNETIMYGNRLYYLRAKTGQDVHTIARYLATSISVYKITLEKFQLNLDYCLQHLEPADVVRHLSILAYASSSIVERLQMLKTFPLNKVKPWMVRVPNLALEKTFDKVLQQGGDRTFKNPLSVVWFENHIVQKMKGLYDFSEKEAKAIYTICKGGVALLDNMEQLQQKGVRKETILKNPLVLAASKEDLDSKLRILSSLNTLRHLNDVIPLCQLKTYQVLKIVRYMNNEQLPKGNNRIYHFADRTGIDPAVVANQFARRTFMFRIPKQSFIENLELFATNMSCEDVLADLWAFKYSPAVVAERIARARAVRGKKLMPWMVRCPDAVLEKSLQLTKDDRELLGDNDTIVEYLGERLGFDRDITNAIILKTPAVKHVRIMKVKKMIDYLLDELDYTPHDIALNIRILMHSLETTKKRMEQLKEIGCRPRSLVIVCKSQRQYDMFVKEWLEGKQRRQKWLESNSS
ncbi:transcription termination factor, mitochondrial [Topomyia yanbarensis]|uniref:transcription termination factor, mitochondrial n=1 Tax=Topomyia yanbarensis TaxID=2498891 RepID=UPI00273ABC6C|nr:transcription termination factor, mitochondrial [Topomyia yanbarensis]XP_058819378.1 transcription termination factor, mitochondrial [Topomyia yanbarensis]